MRNWARNGYWHRVTAPSFTTANGVGTYIAEPSTGLWYHGPGYQAASQGNFCQAIQGEWEGNPEQFLRITWTAAAQAGEAHYLPGFRYTFLEHFGIKRARALSGKQITVSWQLRSPGGCIVIPVIWRGGLNLPAQYRFPFPDTSMQLWSGSPFSVPCTIGRCDFTMTLPGFPAGVDVTENSYLGIGLDFPGQYGPTLDIGPVQINEGGPQPFEEIPYWEEVAFATQP